MRTFGIVEPWIECENWNLNVKYRAQPFNDVAMLCTCQIGQSLLYNNLGVMQRFSQKYDNFTNKKKIKNAYGTTLLCSLIDCNHCTYHVAYMWRLDNGLRIGVHYQSMLHYIVKGRKLSPEQKFYNSLTLHRCIVWSPKIKNVKTEFEKS